VWTYLVNRSRLDEQYSIIAPLFEKYPDIFKDIAESESPFSIELPEECNILNYFMRMLIVKILREEKL